MPNTRCFSRTKRQGPNRSFLIGAFDTETDRFGDEKKNADGTVFNIKDVVKLCTFHHENLAGPGKFDNVPDFLEHILNEWDEKLLRKTIWFSHNGQFDWRFLLSHFKEYDDLYEVRAKERALNTFYELEIINRANGKRVTRFRDSLALFAGSLAEFSKQFAPEHVKGDIGLSWKSFDRKNQSHVEYALNDAKCLVVAIQNLDVKIYEVFGTHIKGTISATAYAAMKNFLPEDETYWRQSQGTEDILRLSYYGGRVQINAPVSEPVQNVTVFDVNSSYPAQMRKGVPKGKAISTRKYRQVLPGFYLANVYVPDDLPLPPIPRKNSKGLCFPTGHFETWVSSLELEQLVKLGGSFEVIDGLYFPQGLCFPFNDFIDVCETTRASYKGTPTEFVIKLIQNSVYGKFGTKAEGRVVILSFDDIAPEGYSCSFDEGTGDFIPYLFWKTEARDAEYMLPHWAGWITANARMTLDEFMEVAGRENVYYGDTDSEHVNAEGARRILEHGDLVGPKYGQFKLEATFAEEAFHGPKFYTSKSGDEIKARIKGIPRSMFRTPANDDPDAQRKIDMSICLKKDLHAGKRVSVDYVSPTSLNTFLKKGTISTMQKRRSSLPENCYGHIVENGRFRPRREGVG